MDYVLTAQVGLPLTPRYHAHMSAPALPPADDGSGAVPPAAPSPPRPTWPELRAVLIGALAGGVTAALVSGAFGFYTSGVQISAEDRRDTSSFLREEQRVVYEEFIADQRRFGYKWAELYGQLAIRQPVEGLLEAELEPLFEALQRSEESLTLVASAKMSELANSAVSEAFDQMETMEQLRVKVRNRPESNPSAESEQAVTGMTEAYDSARQDRRALIEQARLELGAEPLSDYD